MEIQLTGKLGGVAIVSEEDFERVNAEKWNLTPKGYARGCVKGNHINMHGFVMSAKKGEKVDHVNGNKLDNRKENLRMSNYVKNAQNRKVLQTKISSKYKGVFYRNDMELYYEFIIYNKSYYI